MTRLSVFRYMLLILVCITVSMSELTPAYGGSVSITITINIEDNYGDPVPGAQWAIEANNPDWKYSGESDTVKKLNTNYTIIFSTVNSYDAPSTLTLWVAEDDVEQTVYYTKNETESSQLIESWSLVPESPQGVNASVEYDPLSFTIVGSDRNYLSWITPLTSETEDFRGARLYLSDLTSGVVSSDEDISMSSRTIKYFITSGETASDISNVDEDILERVSVFPEYIQEWQTVSGDTVSNQYFASFISDWRSFLDGRKEPDNNYLADPGHGYPQLIWVDNVWLTYMDGYTDGENFKQYLEDVYSDEGWGDALLFFPTNEGLLHAFGVEPFEEHWAILPIPALQWAIFQEQLKQLDGTDYPRINLLDGPIAISDVEHSEEKWRRILVGTTGTGFDLQTKSRDMYALEESGLSDEQIQDLDGSVSRSNTHAWGIYTLNVAEKEGAISPEDPEQLWTVSNVYWTNISTDLSETLGGVLTVNDSRYSYSETPPSGFSGYQDIYMSTARPVVGLTEDSEGNRIWHVVFAVLNKNEDFVLYDVDANTGEIFQSFNLANIPTIVKDGSGNTYSWDVQWNSSFEWKFPTRIGALAKDQVRDNDPDDLTEVDLYTVPYLKEVFVFLSNGALYRWDVYDSYLNGFDSENLKLIMVNQYSAYEDEYEKGESVAGPCTQDFDGTYLTPLEGSSDEYHRFLALPLKGGTDSKESDLRALVEIDVDKITGDDIVLEINKDNAWGLGNQDTVEYLYQDSELYGWFLSLSAGDASTGKFWEESLTISAPVYIDGHIVLATYQPETGYSWIYDLDLDQISDKKKITKDGDYAFETAFLDTEFEGGATITVNEDGEVEFYVGTSGGTISSQVMSEIDTWSETGDGGIDGPASTIYWKVRN